MFLAFVSLVLATLVWVLGLVDSFGKPSVAPTLSLEQQELSLLAQPKVPELLQPLVVGDDPGAALLRTLRETPLDRLDDRQVLLFTALEQDEAYQESLRQVVVGQPDLIPLQQALNGTKAPGQDRSELLALAPDPLIRSVVCRALGGSPADCVDSAQASAAARRLVFSEVFPLATLILGGLLLFRHGFLLLRRCLPPWPPLVSAPLSPLDMVLLVAGGFVVLGEVLVPLLIAPFTAWVSRGMTPALMQGGTVLLGYAALAVPPLLILRQQLSQCDQETPPSGGWLQWQIRPINSALLQGARGWLMVMPPEVVTGWLVSRWIGGEGGLHPGRMPAAARAPGGWGERRHQLKGDRRHGQPDGDVQQDRVQARVALEPLLGAERGRLLRREGRQGDQDHAMTSWIGSAPSVPTSFSSRPLKK